MQVLKSYFFQNIDSKEKAYWLGFCYADSGIKRNGVCFSLAEKDESQIDRFISAVGAVDVKKRNYIVKLKYKGEIREYKAVQICITNVELVSGLKKNGCTEKKSDNIRFPKLIGEEIKLAFLLGFYDGDGMSNSSAICSKSFDFLKDIQDEFKIKFCIRLKKNPFGSVFLMSLGMPLMRILFNNFQESLPRKRIKLVERIYRPRKTRPRKHFYCNCGKEIKRRSKVCPRCNHLSQLRVVRPTKEELISLTDQFGFCKVGRMFGVSDNAIRKWIRSPLTQSKLLIEERSR